MKSITETLSEMEQYAALHKVPIINPICGKQLVEIVKEEKPQHILEIGTAIGYSALLMAANTPASTRIFTIEIDTMRAELARTFWAGAGVNKIEILCGDAGEALKKMEGVFDLVFIDAAKGQYLDYLQKIIPNLSPGAVILADNILFRGWVMGQVDPPKRFRTIVRRLREYISFISTDERFNTTIIAQGDGMAISYYQGANDVEET